MGTSQAEFGAAAGLRAGREGQSAQVTQVVLSVPAGAQIVLHWKYAICSLSLSGDHPGSRAGCSTLSGFGSCAGGGEKKRRHDAEGQRTGPKRDDSHGESELFEEQRGKVVGNED